MAIQSELDIPVKYIGVGEQIDDLQKFDADAFVKCTGFDGRRERSWYRRINKLFTETERGGAKDAYIREL